MENDPGVAEKLKELGRIRQKTIEQLAHAYGAIHLDLLKLVDELDSDITELRGQLSNQS